MEEQIRGRRVDVRTRSAALVARATRSPPAPRSRAATRARRGTHARRPPRREVWAGAPLPAATATTRAAAAPLYRRGASGDAARPTRPPRSRGRVREPQQRDAERGARERARRGYRDGRATQRAAGRAARADARREARRARAAGSCEHRDALGRTCVAVVNMSTPLKRKMPTPWIAKLTLGRGRAGRGFRVRRDPWHGLKQERRAVRDAAAPRRACAAHVRAREAAQRDGRRGTGAGPEALSGGSRASARRAAGGARRRDTSPRAPRGPTPRARRGDDVDREGDRGRHGRRDKAGGVDERATAAARRARLCGRPRARRRRRTPRGASAASVNGAAQRAARPRPRPGRRPLRKRRARPPPPPPRRRSLRRALAPPRAFGRRELPPRRNPPRVAGQTSRRGATSEHRRKHRRAEFARVEGDDRRRCRMPKPRRGVRHARAQHVRPPRRVAKPSKNAAWPKF